MPPKVGDYLCYSVFQGQQLAEPLWGVVIEMGPDQGTADVVLKGSAEFGGDWFTFSAQGRQGITRRTTMSPEAVPDEVVAAIAKRALLGAA
jgi:hypothetical protein